MQRTSSRIAFLAIIILAPFRSFGQSDIQDLIISASVGNTDAQAMLGQKYLAGKGVPRDYKKAIKWLMKAAEQGHAEAQNNVGYCYWAGEGMEQDFKQAFVWYTKSANQ